MSRRQARHATFDGTRVRALRLERGLTNEQLAHEAAVTLRTVQRWQDGGNAPQGAQLLRLARALGVEPGALYTEPLAAA